MRILLLTEYYPPETGATQNRQRSFVQRCRARGIDVTVLTAMPNYPYGRIFDGYRGRWMMRETMDDAKIIRAWILPRPGVSWIGRGLMYMSFAVAALVIGLLYAPRCDLVIWESPPIVLGPTAFLLSRAKGARLVTNISDLWTASLIDLGLVSEGVLVRMMMALEESVYRVSALVTGQTQHIIDDIRRHAGTTEVALWRNGSNLGDTAAESIAGKRAEWGIQPGQFVAGFAGIFGISQGLETICEAAAQVSSPDIRFVMVGGGPVKARIQKLARDMGLTNMIFVPRQPHDAMPSIWGAFDCSIVCLRRLPIFAGAVPSKLFEAMNAGRPVVLGIAGEAAGIVRDAEAGIAIEPENPEELAAAIEQLQESPDQARELGNNGRRAVVKDYDRAVLSDRLIDRLLGLVAK